MWAIGLFQGQLSNLTPFWNEPIFTRENTEPHAIGVADPFVVCEGGYYYMFFELINGITYKGEIALGSSCDGINWNYHRIILAEDFHLSYPHVFKYKDDYFMIPANRIHDLLVYVAVDFPERWKKILHMEVDFAADNMILEEDGKIWLFNQINKFTLGLYQFDFNLTPHPKSPIISSKWLSRPAGRIAQFGGRRIRLSQVNTKTYGRAVVGSEILKINDMEYEEIPFMDYKFIVQDGMVEWAEKGMHHVEQFYIGDQMFTIADGR
jgi:hypothetical protein